VPILRFSLARLASALITLLLVSLIVFLITNVLPGDVATRILGRSPAPDQLAILRQRLGLNEPAMYRYLVWLGKFLSGDLGTSLITGQPVAEIVGRRLGNTGLLSVVALAFYFPLAILPAVFQAVNRGRYLDHAISVVTLGILSLPDFLLGTLLLIFFAIWIPIAPPRSSIDESSSIREIWSALWLPALTISIVMGTYAMRYLRDSLIDVMGADFVRMARLNGIAPATVLWRHVFPNALIPAVNITSLNLTYLFGGVVVVEQVFAFPGFGGLLVSSLMQLDVPVIEATVLIAAAVYIIGNFVADICSMILNPRLREA
jgi:peptide/nickel transport system permease protein